MPDQPAELNRQASRAIKLTSFIVPAVAILFALYFYLHREKQRDYYEAYYGRELGAIAADVRGSLDNAPNVLKYFKAIDCGEEGCRLDASTKREVRERLLEFATPYRNSTLSIQTISSDDDLYEIRHLGSGAELSIHHVIDSEPDARDVAAAGDGPTPQRVLTGRFTLGDFLPEIDSAETFDAILLVDQDGRVLHQASHSLPGVSHLNEVLEQASVEERSIWPFGGDASQKAQKPRTPAAGEALVKRLKSAQRVNARVAGTDYRVFDQAVVVAFLASRKQDAEQAPRWWLVGLVDEDRFEATAGALPLSGLTLAMLVFLSLLLLWPFLRMQFVNPTERFSRGDLVILGTSLGVAMSVVTLVFADLTSLDRLRAKTWTASEKMSSEMRKGFQAELARALFAAEARKADWECAVDLDEESPLVGYELQKPCPPPERSEAQWNFVALPEASRYPDFETMIWMKRNGDRVGPRVTYNERPRGKTNIPNLGTREYVRRVRDGDLWAYRCVAGEENALTAEQCEGVEGVERIFIERILSRRDGLKQTAISMPYRMRAQVYAAEEGKQVEMGMREDLVLVRAIFKRFETFGNPIIGPGYGYAVVDRNDGRVLYHSDDRLSLVENFITETDEDRAVRGALRHAREDHIRGRYHGNLHDLYIAPIENTEWSLVILHDLSFLAAMNFELIAVCLLHLAFFVVSVLVLLGVSGAYRSSSRWAWIWPDAHLFEVYLVVAGVNFITLAYTGWVAWGGLGFAPAMDPANPMLNIGGGPLLLVALSQPVFVISLFYFLAKDATREIDPTSGRGRMGVGLRFAVLLLSGAVLLLPAASRPVERPEQLLLLAASGAIILLLRALVRSLAAVEWRRPKAVDPMVATAYVVMGCGVVLSSAAVPTMAVFRDAYEHQLSRGTLLSLFVIRDEIDRHEALYRAHIDSFDPVRTPIRYKTMAEWVNLMVCGSRDCARETGADAAPSTRRVGGRLVGTGSTFLAGPTLAGDFVTVGVAPPLAEVNESDWLVRAREDFCRDHLTVLLGRRIPPYNRESEALQQYCDVSDRHGSLFVDRMDDSGEPRDVAAAGEASGGKAPPPTASLERSWVARSQSRNDGTLLALDRSLVQDVGLDERGDMQAAVVFCGFATLLSLYLVVRWLTNRVFGLGVRYEVADPVVSWRFLVVGADQARVSEIMRSGSGIGRKLKKVSLADLAYNDGRPNLRFWDERLEAGASTIWLAVNNDELEDRTLRERLLISLETLRRDDCQGDAREKSNAFAFVLQLQDNAIFDPERLASEKGIRAEADRWRTVLRTYQRIDGDGIYRILVGGSAQDEATALRTLGELAKKEKGVTSLDRRRVLALAGDEASEGVGQLEKGSGIFIDDVEQFLVDSDARDALIQLLETVIEHDSQQDVEDRRPILLRFNISPHRFLSAGDHRWSDLLERFAPEFPLQHAHCRPEFMKGEEAKIERALAPERNAWPDFSVVHDRVASELRGSHLDGIRARAILRVSELAGARYHFIWEFSPIDDRLALLHLAQGKLLNTKDISQARRLLDRRLIRRWPDFRIVSESFATFVRTAEARETFNEWESTASRSAWSSMRAPLLIALLACGALVVTAGGAAARSLVTLVTAAAAALPALIQFFGTARRASGSSSER